MMKKMVATALGLAVSAALAMGCFAADSGSVVYTGSALNCSGSMGGFEDMLPGVPSEGSIELTNSSSTTAYFYMDTNVVSTLGGGVAVMADDAESVSTSGAGYEVLLTCGATTLYGSDGTNATGTLVGGAGTAELETLNGQMEGYRLVATLEPGKSTSVKLQITPEAESLDSNYMNAVGNMQFQFYAQNLEPRIENKTNTTYVTEQGEATVVHETRFLRRAAQTGDIAVYVCVGVVILALAVLVLTKKKKKEEQ